MLVGHVVTVDAFVDDRSGAWDELDELVRRAGGRPERLGAAGTLRLATLYRSTAADLAQVRRRWPRHPVADRLTDLVGRARHLVYDAAPARDGVRSFVSTGYWRRITGEPWALAVAAALLLLPAVAAGLWAAARPFDALAVLPEAFRAAVGPEIGPDRPFTAGESAAFSTAIFTNNIRVAFLSFAGGVTGGVVTVVVLLSNGALLGGVAGLATSAGNGGRVLELVVAHGVLELSCIVVAAAAGLRLGWAIVAPGRERRAVAVPRAARAAVEVALGTAPWLVLAGLVEGFVTPAGLGVGVNTAVGVSLGAAFWALVLWRGTSRTSEPEAERSLTAR